MYRIVGADGRQYGPVSAEQLRRWILEGRANAQTLTLAEGGAEWKPLGAVPEFAGLFPAQMPPAIGPVTGSYLRRTNSLALWGMIFGILALFCCCFRIVFGTLGLIFSLIALSQISERPDLYEGRGMAIAGVVLSVVGLLLGVLLLIFYPFAHQWHFYHHFQFR